MIIVDLAEQLRKHMTVDIYVETLDVKYEKDLPEALLKQPNIVDNNEDVVVISSRFNEQDLPRDLLCLILILTLSWM